MQPSGLILVRYPMGDQVKEGQQLQNKIGEALPPT